MFGSIFYSGINVYFILIMVLVAAADGIIAAFLMSLKVRSSKGFFTTIALLPMVVAFSFSFLNVVASNSAVSAIAGIAAIMVGMGLIRFRSAPGKAEEMFALFVAVAIGLVNGLGYLAFATIFAAAVPGAFLGLSSLNFLKNRQMGREKLLKITIPESLEYVEAFEDIFNNYLKEFEMVGVKTVGMGSMYRLSYRIVMKNPKEEKEMIDDLRVRNGNLEISVLPYVENNSTL